jgi:hypothetical protein
MLVLIQFVSIFKLAFNGKGVKIPYLFGSMKVEELRQREKLKFLSRKDLFFASINNKTGIAG